MEVCSTVTAVPPRPPRRRPPLRSYVPFTIFCVLCVLLLSGLIALVAHLIPGAGGHQVAAPRATPTATAAVAQQARTPLALGGATSSHTPIGPVLRHAPAPTATMQTSSMPVVHGELPHLQITPGRPLPTHTPVPTATPRPTATPDGNARAIIARDVDANGNAVEPARRFLSQAMRLYAVVTLNSVGSADVLRFVFERNHRVLPHDDIAYTAGGDSSHTFNAYADYENGARPLPRGQYQLLFYRNGRLEAETSFTVGE